MRLSDPLVTSTRSNPGAVRDQDYEETRGCCNAGRYWGLADPGLSKGARCCGGEPEVASRLTRLPIRECLMIVDQARVVTASCENHHRS